jgi:hypothetical protein
MAFSEANFRLMERLVALGVPSLLEGIFNVTESKNGKSPTHYLGAFIAQKEYKVLAEIRVYSPTYLVIKLYRRGQAAQTLREQSIDDAINKVLIPAGFGN